MQESMQEVSHLLSLEEAFVKSISVSSGNHLQQYLYSTPNFSGDVVNGADLWSKIYEMKDYYVPKEEISLIRLAKEEIGASFSGDPVVLYDLGPGSADAVRKKTIPLLKAFKSVRKYVAVDVCEEFLKQSVDVVSQSGSKVTALGKKGSFDDFICEGDERKIFYLSGSTVSSFGDDHTSNKLSEILDAWSNLMGEGDYFLVTQDTTNDEKKLLNAYLNPTSSNFALNLFHRIKRDLNLENYDPDAFAYEALWNVDLSAMEMFGVCTRAQLITINKNTFDLVKGFKIPIARSYKLPTSSFIHKYEKSGFSHIKSFNKDGSGVFLHLFQRRKATMSLSETSSAA